MTQDDTSRAPEVRAPQREMGSIHAERVPEQRSEQRLRRYGTWVSVNFRGADGNSAIRFPGWVNLAQVRSIAWDPNEGVSVIEYQGQHPDDDGQLVVESPEEILGVGG